MPEGWDQSKIIQIWDGLADAWDRNRDFIWKYTRPVSEHLVALMDPKPGETMLEVGAGTGETGFLIAGKLGDDGKLICTDLSSEMLARARTAAERLGINNVEFRIADVTQLDVEDEGLDGVFGRFVYHLVPDPVAGFREARRALRTGGRLGFAVFGPPGTMKFEDAVVATMDELDLRMPPGITIDIEIDTHEKIESALGEAGFTDIRVEDSPAVITFSDQDAAWRYLTELFGRTAALVAGLSEDLRRAFKEIFLRNLEPYAAGGGYDIPILSLNARAIKTA